MGLHRKDRARSRCSSARTALVPPQAGQYKWVISLKKQGIFQKMLKYIVMLFIIAVILVFLPVNPLQIFIKKTLKFIT